MTRKIYRTANGKMVDLGALQLQNETVRAVGNMGVNARGDLVDSLNKPIKTRNEQVAKTYKRQINSNVSASPVVSSRKDMAEVAQPIAEEPTKPAATKAKEVVEKGVVEPAVVQDTAGTGGLAAALARAREVKQQTLDPAPSRNSNPKI